MEGHGVTLTFLPEEYRVLLRECSDADAFGRAEGPMMLRIRAWRRRLGLLPCEVVHVKVVREDGRPLYPGL